MVENLCTHVLIIEQGKAHFCGTIASLRAEFASEANDESLEDIFFQATNLARTAAAAAEGPAPDTMASAAHAT